MAIIVIFIQPMLLKLGFSFRHDWMVLPYTSNLYPTNLYIA